MAVFRWGRPWIDFQDLEREVDRLLHNVNLTVHGIRFGRQFPQLNMYELPDEYLLTAELPGIRGEQLELTVANGTLTLRGERTTPDELPEEKFRRRERFRGSWQRSITLPDRVNDEAMTAEFEHGVLSIHLPKSPQSPSRQIPVTDGKSVTLIEDEEQ